MCPDFSGKEYQKEIFLEKSVCLTGLYFYTFIWILRLLILQWPALHRSVFQHLEPSSFIVLRYLNNEMKCKTIKDLQILYHHFEPKSTTSNGCCYLKWVHAYKCMSFILNIHNNLLGLFVMILFCPLIAQAFFFLWPSKWNHVFKK